MHAPEDSMNDPTRPPIEHASRQELRWMLKEAMNMAEAGARKTAGAIKELRQRGMADADVVAHLKQTMPEPGFYETMMEMIEDLDPDALQGLAWKE